MNSKGDMLEVRKPAKTQPTCPASRQDKAHTYSLHTLVSVHFTEEKDDQTKATQRICPSCNKILSNASKAMLAKPCGHVVCKSCVHKFMMPSGQIDPHSPGRGVDEVRCYVCDADLSSKKAESNGKAGQAEGDEKKEKIKPGLVELRSEGTGFSAGGTNEVQSTGTLAYQY
jgi:nitric oxide synthase-interacting protein